MKKQLLTIAFVAASFNLFSQSFTVENFEGKALDTDLLMKEWNAPDGTGTVKANPTDAAQKSALIVATNYDAHLKLNVTLPLGKVLSDYDKIKFDIYLVAGHQNNNKQMKIYVDGTLKYADTDYPVQATDAIWTTKEYALTNLIASNTFVLDLGISTHDGYYYIDNIILVEKSATPLNSIDELTFTAFTTSNSIELTQEASSVKVYDITGQLIVAAENTNSVDVTLQNGSIYIVKAIINGKTLTTKLIK